MKIDVIRDTFTEISCIGKMFIDGEQFCNTLEDKYREQDFFPVSKWKVQNKTAVPCGTYDVILDFSEHFHKTMPHILNVEGFTGVRIHGGNYATDTDGCVLVGKERFNDGIKDCPEVYQELVGLISKSIKDGEKVTITISNKE